MRAPCKARAVGIYCWKKGRKIQTGNQIMAQSDMIQSLLKAIDILRLVAESEDGMRLNEIADAFGMKKTTVHNLIRTLRARKFLEKDASNRYVTGSAIQELALLRHRSHLLTNAGKGLRNLARRFPGTIFTFSEATPSAVVCRLRMSPDRPGELQRPPSQFFTPYLSATALCLQANAPNGGELELNFPFDEYGRKYWPDPNAYSETKEKIRKNGFSMIWNGNRHLAMAFYVPENFALGFSCDEAAEQTVREFIEAAAAFSSALFKATDQTSTEPCS